MIVPALVALTASLLPDSRANVPIFIDVSVIMMIVPVRHAPKEPVQLETFALAQPLITVHNSVIIVVVFHARLVSDHLMECALIPAHLSLDVMLMILTVSA